MSDTTNDENAQALDELGKLLAAGILPQSAYDAAVRDLQQERSYEAEAGEDSAIAQGPGAVALARGATHIAGDVQGNLYIGEPSDDPQEALRIYRQVLLHSSSNLPLRGVDVGASDPATAKQLSLANVYIDLDTTGRHIQTADEHDPDTYEEIFEETGVALRELRKDVAVGERPLTALEATIDNRWLVLTGDPGGGKSTFVNHIAHCLAAYALQPDGDWLAHLPEWPPEEGKLLPLVVILRDFAAYVDEVPKRAANPRDLWQFICERLEDQNLGFATKAIQYELHHGRAILFLDGLDEVPGTKQRRYVRDAVAAFADIYRGNRFLVTCRILSYQPPDSEDEPDLRLDLNDFPIYEIAPFDEEKIDRFIGAWYEELGRIGSVPTQDANRLAGKLKEAVRRPDLWRMAPTPLLLTVMALVHAHQGRLPDARALLYEQTVDMLLWRWEEVKSSGGEQTLTLRQLLLDAERADLDLKRLLWRLAYEAHGQSAGEEGPDGLGDIAEGQLTRALEKLKRGDWGWVHQMVEAMKLRAGLLLERSPGVFTFPHRTFQEYLAGAYLSTQPDSGLRAAELGMEGAHWREAILLAAGRLVHVAGDVEKALAMVNRLCPAGEPKTESGWRNAWLAADALREIGLRRVQDDDWGLVLLERVQERLAQLVSQGELAPRERADVGDLLADIGDPRPGVLTLEPELVTIPAGPFLMGDELHEITIAEPFAIGRTPVTNAQFRLFWEDGGYSEKWRHCWTSEGWAWREKEEITRPRFADLTERNRPNQPVTGVSWYEAVAYASWLGEKTGRPYHLPTEAEWERAARHTDGRTYPWGENWPDGIANTEEVGLERPCAVGMFPGDRSEAGVLDMSGNVNEWCRTRWQNEEGKAYPLPYRPDDGREELGGGNDVWRVVKGGSYYDDKIDWPRCAARIWDLPHLNYANYGFRVVLSPLLTSGL